MLERILDLEVALYPLAFTFHSLDGLANYWTSELNSNLIPIADGRGNIMVSSAEKAGYVEIPPQDTWHQVRIVPRSGIDVSNSPKIHDDFEILFVIMSGPGAGGQRWRHHNGGCASRDREFGVQMITVELMRNSDGVVREVDRGVGHLLKNRNLISR